MGRVECGVWDVEGRVVECDVVEREWERAEEEEEKRRRGGQQQQVGSKAGRGMVGAFQLSWCG